jgi:hypothetical protein
MNLPFYHTIELEQVQEGMTTQSLLGAAILFALVVPVAGFIMAMCLKAISDRHPETAASGAEAGILSVMGRLRLSWPLLVALIIFIVMMTLEIILIVSGKPLINL